MKFSIKTALVLTCSAATFLATTAQAETTYYLGGGLGYSLAESRGGSSTAEGNIGVLGITAGIRYDAQNYFYGAELDSDVAVFGETKFGGNTCSDGASDPYFCSQTATVRMRGIVGTEFSGYEVFGTFGYAAMFGESAVFIIDQEPAAVSGLTYGLGVQTGLGSGTVRLEVIRDQLTNTLYNGDNYNPNWNATSVKVSYLYNF